MKCWLLNVKSVKVKDVEKSKLVVHLQIYKFNCVILKKAIGNAKACFYHPSIWNCNGNQKQLFVIVNGSLGNSRQPTLPSLDDPSAIATKFNN